MKKLSKGLWINGALYFQMSRNGDEVTYATMRGPQFIFKPEVRNGCEEVSESVKRMMGVALAARAGQLPGNQQATEQGADLKDIAIPEVRQDWQY